MNKITIGTITVVVTATAVIGYLTKTKVDALQGNLKSTKVEVAQTRKSLEDTKQTLAKTADDLVAANKSLTDEKAKLDTMVAERDSLTKQVAEQDIVIKDKEQKLADANKQLALIQQPGDPSMTPEALGAKIKQLLEEHDQLTAQLDTLKQENEKLSNEAKGSRTALAAAAEKVRHYEHNIAKMGLTGRVLAVNPGWNFVVLDIGDRSGAAVNAPIVVSRNGQNIAKARIKTVEPGMSVADIIPESVSRGATVQPGDQVVFTQL